MKEWIPEYTEAEIRGAFKEAGKEDMLTNMTLSRPDGREVMGRILFNKIHIIQPMTGEIERMLNYASSGDIVNNLRRVAAAGARHYTTWNQCDRWASIDEFVKFAICQFNRGGLEDADKVYIELLSMLSEGHPSTHAMPESELELCRRDIEVAKSKPELAGDLKAVEERLASGYDPYGSYNLDEKSIEAVASSVAEVLVTYKDSIYIFTELGKAFMQIEEALYTIDAAIQHSTPPELTQPLSNILEGKAAKAAIEACKVLGNV